MFDLIGDIHGHAEPLRWMLERLGYDRRRGYYQHPRRRVVFVGDWIDRGPEIREVMQIVRPMVDHGSALAVMGNHEFNAISYHTRRVDNPDRFLRPHIHKNVNQHWQSLRQLPSTELYELVDWFRRLPLWLELDGIRVIHACWDERAIDELQEALTVQHGLSQRFLEQANNPEDSLYDAVSTVLKGKELPLPDGRKFTDKDGHDRGNVRTQWFRSPDGLSLAEYSLPQIEGDDQLAELPVPPAVCEEAEIYPADAPPVFIGHYWLRAESAQRLAPNVACLDYSVAKDGMLCAYRWDGEAEIDNSKFVTVESR